MLEEELINACINGDRISQKKMYDTFKKQMYTLSYRITNNFEDAEDVLQEGFLKVFKNLKTFKSESKLSTWIHTIILRTAIQKINSKIIFTPYESIENEESIQITYPTDVEYLERVIQQLPDGYRTVFTLYEIEGFKHNEIAKLLDISINTSKTQLRNAKKVMRDKLKNYSING